MDVYRRYASREHDTRHFTSDLRPDHIKLYPLSASFDSPAPAESSVKSVEFWKKIFENAAFFHGNDPQLFGPVVTVVYKNTSTDKLCALSITKFGSNVYENLMLDSSSRFWPACQNLPENMRRSNVRRALAVSNLKNYNKLWNNKGLVDITQHWDETNAGSLAGSMKLVDSVSSAELGSKILAMGIIQELSISSLVVDVLYNNSPEETNEVTISDNNKLVLCLGEQLDLLFDPLLEYSPQAMEIAYHVPENPRTPELSNNLKVEQVIDELIAVQTNYTNDLVNVLQNFIIPLRVSVLASSSNSGMAKVNLAFPPTIDEITRVNCIVHYLLNEAKEYGYVEVFKVLGSFLRFFYKAFVRHQANLSDFNARFDKFVENNYSYAFESATINLCQFAPRAIKTIIVDSVLELPRLKLIIKRLYETIKEEKSKLKTSKHSHLDEDNEIDANYASAMAVIDSFGYQETEADRKTRVFTPSGKLLTEWATEWPAELQYGWISRKVVGIFSLTNTKSTRDNEEIAIVFTDHILFLEILEPSDLATTQILPDILMNSLVNEKPLPKLSTLPKLRVKYWCPITNLVLRSFQSDDGYCLNFTTLSGNRLKNKDETAILFTENYRIPRSSDSFSTCNRIIDVVSKAQVLHKSTPFHLFKYDGGDFRRYFCAHEYGSYGEEMSKSPIALFLNMDDDKISSVLHQNPFIFFVLSVSSVNEHTVSLVGRDRHENLKVEEIVSLEDMRTSLKDIFFKAIDAMSRSSYFSKVITEGNVSLIEHFVQELNMEDHGVDKMSLNPSLKISGEEDLTINLIEEKSPKKQIGSSVALKVTTEEHNPEKVKRRKSGIFRIFEKFKHKNETKNLQITKETIPAKKQRSAAIANTYIPKGKRTVYKSLYKPEPVLRDASATSSAQVSETQVSTGPVSKGLETYQEVIETASEENQVVSTASTLKESQGELDVPYPMEYPETRTTSYVTGSSSNYNESLSLDQIGSRIETNKDLTGTEAYKLIDKPESAPNEPNSVNTTVYNPVEDFETAISNQHEQPTANPTVSSSADSARQVLQDTPQENVMPNILKNSQQGNVSPTKLQNSPQGNMNLTELQIPPQESQSKAPAVPPHKFNSLFEKKPVATSTKRVVSGQDIAKALDNINAIGILPFVHERYKIYDMIPNSVLSSDGTSNWTAVMSESSSNLQAEIMAMKEEAHMDTVDVIDYNPKAEESYASPVNTSAGTVATENFSIVDMSRIQQVPVQNGVGITQIARDESTQSLTPEQLAREFGSQLDQEFDLDGIELDRSLTTLCSGKLDPLHSRPLEREKSLFHSLDFGSMGFDSDTSDESVATHIPDMIVKGNALGQKRQLLTSTPDLAILEPLQPADLSSTDEEYFLTSEIMGLNYYLSENITTGLRLLSSPSSEQTLKNDFDAEKLEPLFDEKLRSESVAYLSGILRGEIEI